MKTEMEKCLAGEWYDCHNQVFLDLKTRTHKLLMKYNSLPYEDKEEKHSLLKKMLGSIGMKVSVASPFLRSINTLFSRASQPTAKAVLSTLRFTFRASSGMEIPSTSLRTCQIFPALTPTIFLSIVVFLKLIQKGN